MLTKQHRTEDNDRHHTVKVDKKPKQKISQQSAT